MQKLLTRTLLTGAAIVLFGSGVASAETKATPAVIVAQASPAPSTKPAATPAPFTYTISGYDRAYYFTRTNTSSNSAKPWNYINQASFNNGTSLHGDATFGGNWTIGATYFYAEPFNNCDDPLVHQFGPGNCKKKGAPATAAAAQNFTATTYDDTLPAYKLSTLDEAYLQYKDLGSGSTIWIGQRANFNTPWANPSDSRLKPVAFRGGDATIILNKQWTLEFADMISWEERVESDFLRSNILTQNGSYLDAGGISQTGIPSGQTVNTNGFLYGRLGYNAAPWVANLHVYAFNNVANALWVDAKYSWKAYAKPFIAFQGGTEQDTGSHIAGKINSQIFGVQLGATPWKNVDLTAGFDAIPEKTDNVTLPAGVACSAGHLITGAGAAHPFNYFLPAGGTPQCVSSTPGVAGGPATIYYGGWASPYTDSYATDQLFTTTISQGMADRRSPGQSAKVGSTINLDNKQVRIILAHAWYWYGNNTFGVAPTQETNVDGTYFFSKYPAKGPYHGFSIRHRYAERTTLQGFGGLPEFKYNRTQLEFDF